MGRQVSVTLGDTMSDVRNCSGPSNKPTPPPEYPSQSVGPVLWICGRVLRTGTRPAGRGDKPVDNAGALPTALPPLAYLSPTNSTGPTILISTTRRSRVRGCSEACTNQKRAALWCQFQRRSRLRAEFSKLTGSGSFRYWIRLSVRGSYVKKRIRRHYAIR